MVFDRQPCLLRSSQGQGGRATTGRPYRMLRCFAGLRQRERPQAAPTSLQQIFSFYTVFAYTFTLRLGNHTFSIYDKGWKDLCLAALQPLPDHNLNPAGLFQLNPAQIPVLRSSGPAVHGPPGKDPVAF